MAMHTDRPFLSPQHTTTTVHADAPHPRAGGRAHQHLLLHPPRHELPHDPQVRPLTRSPLPHSILTPPTNPITIPPTHSIDLLSEVPPAISFAWEASESNVMDRPPRNRKVDRLVRPSLLAYCYGQVRASVGGCGS